jgi:transcriptional regulator with XRE-family HTH domain
MTLDEYCKTYGLKNREITAATGISMVTVSKYRNGKFIPRPANMAKLSKLTNGLVSADDFYKKPDAPIPSKGNRKRQVPPVSTCAKCKSHTSTDSHTVCKNGSPKISPPVQGGV